MNTKAEPGPDIAKMLAEALEKRADWLRDERHRGGDFHHLMSREGECRWLAEQSVKGSGPFAGLHAAIAAAVAQETERCRKAICAGCHNEWPIKDYHGHSCHMPPGWTIPNITDECKAVAIREGSR